MQLTFLDLLERQEAINDVNCHIERLRLESELPVNVNNPLNEESTAGILDLGWNLNLREVVRANLELNFLFAHVVVYVLGHLGHHLRVANVEGIREDHTLSHSTAPLSESILEGFGDRYTIRSLGLALG